jgi:hypothetical protein
MRKVVLLICLAFGNLPVALAQLQENNTVVFKTQ